MKRRDFLRSILQCVAVLPIAPILALAPKQTRAMGGPVKPGIPYLIGGDKSEMFVPCHGGHSIFSTDWVKRGPVIHPKIESSVSFYKGFDIPYQNDHRFDAAHYTTGQVSVSENDLEWSK